MKENVLKIFLLAVAFIVPTSGFANDAAPDFRKAVVPSYPVLAIHLGLEEQITANVLIDRKGRVISVEFNRGDRNFHTIIENALNGWVFQRSSKTRRKAKIRFVFRLVPSDSLFAPSTISRFPLTVEIIAKRIKAVDSKG
jgi:hypothetical protein